VIFNNWLYKDCFHSINPKLLRYHIHNLSFLCLMFKKSTLLNGSSFRFRVLALVLIVSCHLSIINSTSAQVGGNSIYSFLDIPASARIAAMGGTFIYVKDADLNSALQNPAALNPEMNNYLSMSFLSLSDGIKFGDAAYAKDFKKLGTFNVWMHYASYGTFQQTDVTGVVDGSFTAADYALSVGWGYQLNPLFSVGANLKGIYSDYYIVTSTGLAADFSGMLYDSTSGFTATVLARNIGAQLKPYVAGNTEPLPLEAVVAISEKPKHVPARISITYRHLEKFDMTFVDPNDPNNYDALTGSYSPQTAGFGTKLIRHFTFGLEILLSQNFNLRASYNVQRLKELEVSTAPGTVGLSFGAGLKISKFILSYGHANYHLAGGSNHFSIAANLIEFTKKK